MNAMEQKRKIVPPVYLLGALLMMMVMNQWAPLGQYVAAPFHYGGIILASIGVVMAAISAGAFKKADTGVVPFEEATVLVTGGFYRFTRNPMYLGMAMFLAGVSVLIGTTGTLLPIPFFIAVIHLNFILGEESFLEDAFGEEYLGYKKKVRRWL